MAMTCGVSKHSGEGIAFYLVDSACHPQTIAVVATRAVARGIEVRVDDPANFEFGNGVVGCLVQYPATDGAVRDYAPRCARAHEAGALVTVATDLLALALLKPPGEWGADGAVGNTQRFGVPVGFGGPHAAYLAVRDEFKRQMPGRLVGETVAAQGIPALPQDNRVAREPQRLVARGRREAAWLHARQRNVLRYAHVRHRRTHASVA